MKPAEQALPQSGLNGMLFCARAFYAVMILMVFISRAKTANLQELHRFEANLAGPSAAGLFQGSNGILYGTMVTGGSYNLGTIFQITTNGLLSILVSFNGTNGANPYANVIQASDGNFYGTASAGGQYNLGTIFVWNTNAGLVNLVSFNRTNGASPYSGLIETTAGSFLGTCYSGGDSNNGTIFQASANGDLTTVISFSGTNGSYPKTGLNKASDGFLYGTTVSGGMFNQGTVFQFQGNGVLNQIYSFDGTNGSSPCSGVIRASDGLLYGTCQYGGAQGYGNVYKLTTNGVVNSIFSFDYARGSQPKAALVETTPGTFFGTTSDGGTYNGGLYINSGTVFKITSAGALTTYPFSVYDGWYPQSGFIKASDGNLYGTTYNCYNSSSGTIYRFRTNGVLTLLANFTSTNGYGPVDNLVTGDDGCLYGTTTAGGDFGRGIFYRITTNGVVTKLASFSGSPGEYPSGKLVAGGSGLFYGISVNSISYSGRVYIANTNGTITTLTTLSSSTQPNKDLIMGPDNALYGTTREGGAGSCGSIFRVTTNGNLSTLYSLASSNAFPDSGVSVGPDGSFYGTSVNTVYRCTTGGVFTTLLTVKSNSIYQGAPYFSALTICSNGMMYAMTVYGGNAAHGPGSGYGTVIQLSTNGNYTPLLLFNGTNGMNMVEVEPPVLGTDGALFGISPHGGIGYNGNNTSGKGIAFRLTTNGTFTPLILCDTNTKVSGTFNLGNDGQLYCVGYQNGAGNSGSSVFRLDLRNQILVPTQTPDGVLISFSGLPDNQYRLLRTTNLAGIWETLTTLKADLLCRNLLV